MSARRDSGLVIERHERDGQCTIELAGELDLASAPELQRTIALVCKADGIHSITLELGSLTFIDSTGLAAIVYGSRLCEQNRCDLTVANATVPVQRVFELTGLDDSVRIVSSGERT